MRIKNANAWIERFIPCLYFLFLLLGLEAVNGGFFLSHFGLLGHDFAPLYPTLFDGVFGFGKTVYFPFLGLHLHSVAASHFSQTQYLSIIPWFNGWHFLCP